MRIGEANSLGGQSIEVWGGNLASLGVVTLNITVAEIVGVDDHHVGSSDGCLGGAA